MQTLFNGIRFARVIDNVIENNFTFSYNVLRIHALHIFMSPVSNIV